MSVGLLDFFILEASDYVERLDALLASAAPHGPHSDAFTRLARGLRGSATMAKLPALAELAAAVERVGRALHDRSATWNGTLAGEMVAAVDDLKILLHAVRTWGPAEDERARARLRRIVAVMPAAGGSAPTPSVATGGAPFAGPPAGEIASALAAPGGWNGHPHEAAAVARAEGDQARPVVPIAELFYAGADGVLSRSPAPPTTPTARFGTEVVAHAEHLAAMLGAAGAAGEAEHRARLARELRAALRALRDLAESYGEHDVARFAAGLAGPATSFDAGALATLASGAALLAAAGAPTGERVRRLRELLGEREPEPQTAAREPAGTAERPAAPTPTGKELQALLQNSIAGIALLDHSRTSDAASAPADADVVPIETLLYRGPAALARAREIRDQLRRIGGPQLPDALVELFDLLDLAAAE